MEQGIIHRILLSSEGNPDAERLLNLLRRSGLSLQGRDVAPDRSFTDILAAEPWHLILLFTTSQSTTTAEALDHLGETRLDIPCVIIHNETSTPAPLHYLSRGAADIFEIEELRQDSGQRRFVHRIRRELQQLTERRERRQLAMALREIEQHYHQLLDGTTDPVAWLSDGLYQYCNPAWLEFLGCQESVSVLHNPFLDQVAEADVEPVRRFLQTVTDPGAGRRPEERCELSLRHQDGSTTRVEMDCTVISHQGERHLQVRLRPATGTSGQHNRADDLGSRDLVTGLPARKRMLDAITRQVSRAVYQGETATLVVLELDDFDSVRSVLGRSESNLVLGDFIEALRHRFPDQRRIGRISDNGFAVLLPAAAGPDTLLQQMPEIERTLLALLPERLECQLSAGMAVISGESADAETLLVRAQHNRVLRMSQRTELGSHSRYRRQLDMISRALEGEDGLTLVYQPVVSLHEDELERYEVRVRLHDGEQLIPPAEFLETVTQHGLGETLDRRVLQQALDMLTSSNHRNLRLFLNVTLNTITGGTVLNWLAEALRMRRLNANQLVIQISEIDALSALEEVEHFGRQLRELDTGISVTHFGSAMDPLEYLRNLPVEYVKLDRALLSGIDRDAGQKDRLHQLVSSLHSRGILVIAPMVERMEILPLLWQARVNFVQGNVLREPTATLDFGFVQDEEITLDFPSDRSD